MIELGLAYEHKKILPRGAEMDDPDFRALNERHKIPFYQDDRVKIGESAAIVPVRRVRLTESIERLFVIRKFYGLRSRFSIRDRDLFKIYASHFSNKLVRPEA